MVKLSSGALPAFLLASSLIGAQAFTGGLKSSQSQQHGSFLQMVCFCHRHGRMCFGLSSCECIHSRFQLEVNQRVSTPESSFGFRPLKIFLSAIHVLDFNMESQLSNQVDSFFLPRLGLLLGFCRDVAVSGGL